MDSLSDNVRRFWLDSDTRHDLEERGTWPELFKRWAYRQTFCDMFAEALPTQWADLLTWAPFADAYLSAAAEVLSTRSREFSQFEEDRNPAPLEEHFLVANARERLDTAARDWANAANLGAEWIANVAAKTLLVVATARRTANGDPPTLVFFTELATYGLPEDRIGLAVVPVEANLGATATFQLPAVTWNQTLESYAEFKKRALAEVTACLEASQSVDAEPAEQHRVEPRPVNRHYIAWLFDAYVLGLSKYAIARKGPAIVSETAVTKGIDQAAETLGLPRTRKH